MRRQHGGKPDEGGVKPAAGRQERRAPVGKEEDEQGRGEKKQMGSHRAAPISPEKAKPRPGQAAARAGQAKQTPDGTPPKTVQSQKAEDQKVHRGQFQARLPDSQFDVTRPFPRVQH